MEGEVVAVGPGARNEQGQIVALDVKAGDRILFGKWSGTEVKIDGEELLIMKESDIMGIVEAASARRGRLQRPVSQRRLRESSQTHTRRDNMAAKDVRFGPTRASACCAASTSSPTR